MKLSLEKWESAFRKALADQPACGAADQVVCAVATLRYLRDGLAAAIPDSAGDIAKEMNEIIREVSAGAKLNGFASNGSSAAGAFKLKGEAKALSALFE